MEVGIIEVIFLAIAFLMMPVIFVVSIVSFVFFVSYIFFWQHTRRWFNRRAGLDFMPLKRICREQVICMRLAIVISAFMVLCNVMAWSSDIGRYGSLIYIAIGIWAFFTYRKVVPIVGKQCAKWAALYQFASTLAIMALTIMLSQLALFAYVIILFFTSGAVDYFMPSAPNGSSSSSSGPLFRGVVRETESGERVTLDQMEDGDYRDSKGGGFREDSSGRVSRK